MYHAHSTSRLDRADWQALAPHLTGVADLAAAYGSAIGIERACYLCGLLHDLGKYSPRFQARLTGASETVDHSTAGAAIARRLARGGGDAMMAELIAYAIAGHHAGLPDMRGEGAGTLAHRLQSFREADLDPRWIGEIKPDATRLMPDFLQRADREAPHAQAWNSFRFAFLGRMIFSCLVDADFKDTERFYASVDGREIDRDWPRLRDALPGLIAAYDAHMQEKRQGEGPVNTLRGRILDAVRARAAVQPGLFVLTVPTGGGKTLASLGFALDHARAHGHERIIYAIPFTSIIDQTATIFRKVLGAQHVLEHHSAIEEEDGPREAREADSTRADRDKLKLAMEDWAAPVVVTTNVQLFESLFAARTSRCRKLHNIARSVIILDEAQTLPRPLLIPAVWALRVLAEDYGCSIVLCTATQPALDATKFPAGHRAGLPLAGRELAPEPADLARSLRRVTMREAGCMDDAALVAELAAVEQGLIIVNTRKHALGLYRAARSQGLAGVVHLTTRQYAAHRRAIIEEVRRRLKAEEPCRLIATSLVEAGVDLDFPRVWRAEAGLDQVMQAAGRCNREGDRPIAESIVTVFTSPDNPPPPEIRNLAGDKTRMMGKHDDLFSPAAMDAYFAEVYWRIGQERLDERRVVDRFLMTARETAFSYRSVAADFRMIDSGMAPVIVARDAEAHRSVEKLSIAAIPSGAIARELQIYIVQMPPKARARLIACGHVRFEQPGIREDQFAVLQTPSLYQDEVGLVWEDAEYLRLEVS